MAPESEGEARQSWTRQYRRPYTVTKGRTQPTDVELAVEALVSTTTLGLTRPPTNRQQRSITALCQREIMSIAEISAHMDLPLGATRILVGDMAHLGLVTIHQPLTSGGRPPDAAVLERVLYKLRAL
jgi:hypothetical protein